MVTPLDHQKYNNSLNAHYQAKQQIYPLIFNYDVVVEHQDRNYKDLEDKIDVEVTYFDSEKNAPIVLSIQERWRDISFQHYQDITITAVNTNTGIPVEFYTGKMDFILYGYYDKRRGVFGDVIMVNFARLRYLYTQGYLGKNTNNNGGSKNQDFYCFKFRDLLRHNCVEWHNTRYR